MLNPIAATSWGSYFSAGRKGFLWQTWWFESPSLSWTPLKPQIFQWYVCHSYSISNLQYTGLVCEAMTWDYGWPNVLYVLFPCVKRWDFWVIVDTDRENTKGITITPTQSLLSSSNHNTHPLFLFPHSSQKGKSLLQIFSVGYLFLTTCLCIEQSQLHVFLSAELWLLQHKCCKPVPSSYRD